LKSIVSQNPNENENIEQNVLKLFLGSISRSKEEMKVSILLELISFWKQNSFSSELLENFLISSFESHNLSKVFAEMVKNAKNSSNPWHFDFSPKFYLKVVQTYYAQEIPEDKSNVEQKMWSGIKDNLEKEIVKSILLQKIDIPISKKENFAKEESLVFTCSHSFTRNVFNDSILTEFEKRINELDIPLTKLFVMSEYNQKFINLACPVCLYGTLREIHSKVFPNFKLSEWNY